MTESAYATAGMPPNALCVVMVQSALVALDIRLAISDAVPGANVMVVQNVVGALQALEGVDRVHVAFLEPAPPIDKGCPLAEAVRLRGGRVVFLGDEAEDLGPGPGWTVLVRPFTNNCVLAALKGPSQDRPWWPIRQPRRMALTARGGGVVSQEPRTTHHFAQ